MHFAHAFIMKLEDTEIQLARGTCFHMHPHAAPYEIGGVRLNWNWYIKKALEENGREQTSCKKT
jgi:hypothetical protein